MSETSTIRDKSPEHDVPTECTNTRSREVLPSQLIPLEVPPFLGKLERFLGTILPESV
jgi:hypothetical protein